MTPTALGDFQSRTIPPTFSGWLFNIGAILVPIIAAVLGAVIQNMGNNYTPTPPSTTEVAQIASDEPDPTQDINADDARATGAAQAYETLTALAPTDGAVIEPGGTVNLTPDIEDTLTPTNTPTLTPTPIQVASVPLVVRSLSGNEIGNGNLRVYGPYSVDFPETFRIELKLTFDNYYITPTPFGPRTVVPANTGTPRSLTTPSVQSTPTPRVPRFESPPGSIEFYELMGATLNCLETSFSGCDEETSTTDAKRITLDGVEWTWIVTPREGIRGNQDLSIEVWRVISINDGPERAEVVWDYPFQIAVRTEGENLVANTIRENIGALIGAVSAIIVALISGGYLIRKRRNEPTESRSAEAPKVFISYRRGVSAGFAQTLHDRLEARGAEVFIDVDDIHAGSFSDYIKEHIMKSDYFVVVLAPETLKSDWVLKEITYAQEHKKTIIPVLVNDFDLYGSEVTSDLQFLQSQNAVELRPQYVDAAIARIAKYIGLEGDGT